MKLEEVCKALLEEKVLISTSGYMYKSFGMVLYKKQEDSSEWDLSSIIYPFLYPEDMSVYEEYNLTFFEAMCKAAYGWIVSNDDWSKPEYVMHDGKPYYSGNGEIASFRRSELQAKWKVVRKVEE